MIDYCTLPHIAVQDNSDAVKSRQIGSRPRDGNCTLIPRIGVPIQHIKEESGLYGSFIVLRGAVVFFITEIALSLGD